ncbi:hypothetical protein [Sphingomicrobium nitratireducens]|uniref:hypothetical protein n=1 Tax=Sphingomicrobium nitratireducens TaxID=2964666 RepID=UPI00223FB758|nr:hypothetical protein [Sphingomicrobium nitratireducens]
MKTMAIAGLAVSALVLGSPASAHEPTCSGFGTLANHGNHVVGDYVSGLGGFDLGDGMGWPPPGHEVGAANKANGGALTPGGPGPGSHFEWGGAPGASFCNDSNSPGYHYDDLGF